MTLLDESIEWDSAKKVLNQREFIKRLTKYDRKNVQIDTKLKLKEYNLSNINFEAINQISSTAGSLCLWVQFIENYQTLVAKTNPMQLKIKELNEELRQKEKVL